MLLYDLAVRAGYRLPKLPIFEISNVADWCERAKSWEEWGEEELLNVTCAFPPFRSFWIEYTSRHLQTVTTNKKGNWETTRIGEYWRTARLYNERPKDADKLVAPWDSLIVQAVCFIGRRYTHPDFPGRFKDVVSVTGQEPEINAIRGELQPWDFNFDNNGTGFLLSPNGSVIADSLRVKCDGVPARQIALTFLPALRSFWFMNFPTRSKRLVEGVAPRAERRQAERDGRPLSTFKILEIGEDLTSQTREYTEAQTHNRFHIARGYIAPYCPDHGTGLFGKGVYACPCHTKQPGFWKASSKRGNRDLGEVEKVYQVTP